MAKRLQLGTQQLENAQLSTKSVTDELAAMTEQVAVLQKKHEEVVAKLDAEVKKNNSLQQELESAKKSVEEA